MMLRISESFKEKFHFHLPLYSGLANVRIIMFIDNETLITMATFQYGHVWGIVLQKGWENTKHNLAHYSFD
jgi:hypothetical protein